MKTKKINQKSKKSIKKLKCNVKYSISDMRDVNETGMNENAASEVAMVACRVCTRLIHLNTYFFTHNSITK